jgi:hypothetical protein
MSDHRPSGLCHAARFANERKIRASMPLFSSPDINLGRHSLRSFAWRKPLIGQT